MTPYEKNIYMGIPKADDHENPNYVSATSKIPDQSNSYFSAKEFKDNSGFYTPKNISEINNSSFKDSKFKPQPGQNGGDISKIYTSNMLDSEAIKPYAKTDMNR